MEIIKSWFSHNVIILPSPTTWPRRAMEAERYPDLHGQRDHNGTGLRYLLSIIRAAGNLLTVGQYSIEYLPYRQQVVGGHNARTQTWSVHVIRMPGLTTMERKRLTILPLIIPRCSQHWGIIASSAASLIPAIIKLLYSCIFPSN
jgi:hypothetical protein